MKLLTLIFYDDFNHKNIQTLMVVLTSVTWRRCFGETLVTLKIIWETGTSLMILTIMSKKHLEEMFWWEDLLRFRFLLGYDPAHRSCSSGWWGNSLVLMIWFKFGRSIVFKECVYQFLIILYFIFCIFKNVLTSSSSRKSLGLDGPSMSSSESESESCWIIRIMVTLIIILLNEDILNGDNKRGTWTISYSNQNSFFVK